MSSSERGSRMPGDDVLPLSVDEELAADAALTCRGVAAEADAGRAIVALVAEHHLHHVDGRAEIVGDLVRLPVHARTRRVPRVEDGAHRAQQLLVRVERERPARPRPRRSADSARSAASGRPRSARRRRGCRTRPSARRAPARSDDASMPSTTSPYIWISRRYESNANRSFPVAAASPRVVSSLSPRSRIVSIIPGIEIAAPERTETSSGLDGSPKPAPVASSRRPMWLVDLVLEAGRQLAARRHVGATRVRRDREPGGDGHVEVRHLREPDALAAEQLPSAVGRLVERVDEPHSCLWLPGRDLHRGRSSRGVTLTTFLDHHRRASVNPPAPPAALPRSRRSSLPRFSEPDGRERDGYRGKSRGPHGAPRLTDAWLWLSLRRRS